jgi:hypothetical protein
MHLDCLKPIVGTMWGLDHPPIARLQVYVLLSHKKTLQPWPATHQHSFLQRLVLIITTLLVLFYNLSTPSAIHQKIFIILVEFWTASAFIMMSTHGAQKKLWYQLIEPNQPVYYYWKWGRISFDNKQWMHFDLVCLPPNAKRPYSSQMTRWSPL